ncbi:hypothetical protein ACFPK1_02265 [Actinomycetospora rhizophila]|uniref:Uncharacterized protein n=1 Tax=Actinomycetospora rhizophila TaxID=1416876 RepID=A0ABV9ZA08_9PSEU
MLGGGALAGVSAVGVAGSVGVTATGVGAPVGVPFGALSAAGVATGAAMAGLGAADTVQHALTDDRVAPFTVATDADAGSDAPLPPAEQLRSVGEPGKNRNVRQLPTSGDVEALYEDLADGAEPTSWTNYSGRVVRLSDGTEIGLRDEARSPGTTIDARLPNGERWKIHIPLN